MISNLRTDNELAKKQKDFIKNRDPGKIVYTQVFDFNTEEKTEEEQMHYASLLFSDEIEQVKEAFSFFAQYCSSLHIPIGEAIVRLQDSIVHFFIV